MARQQRLLIVEDEEAILMGLVEEFSCQGFAVDFSWNGQEGLKKALENDYDLLLLDIMLPGQDGLSICSEIRKAKPKQAIIILTARNCREDIITGLKCGADDYISKPFSLSELILRVKAVLRRTSPLPTEDAELVLPSGLKIDVLNLEGRYTETSLAGVDDKIQFSRKEVEILQYLTKHSDRPVSRGELLEEVWGLRTARNIQTRTVDIHIAKLRQKIEVDPKNPRYLVTVWSEGYKLVNTENHAV